MTPPALRAIADDPETRIDGFILPGHVSTITGLEPYQFLVGDYGIPGVVTGFEPVDILESIVLLAEMALSGTPRIQNAYRRGVADTGNPVARKLVDPGVCGVRRHLARPGHAAGIGSCHPRGVRRPFDARRRFPVEVPPTQEPRGCRCGDVLRGAITPHGCPLFGRTCTPEHPVGPCMVSSEGSCAAYFRYHE